MRLRFSAARLTLAAAVAVVSGCRLGGPTTAFPDDGHALEPLRQRYGTYSGLPRRVKWIVQNPRELVRLPVDIGPVDFERETVLLVGMGPTPSADYAVRLKRVYRDGGSLRAEIEYLYPPDATAGLPTPASPYHIVVVPRSDLTIVGFTAPD